MNGKVFVRVDSSVHGFSAAERSKLINHGFMSLRESLDFDNVSPARVFELRRSLQVIHKSDVEARRRAAVAAEEARRLAADRASRRAAAHLAIRGISIIEGDLGSGKSLTAVLLARYHRFKLGRDIFANFEIRGVGCSPIKCYGDLENCHSGLLILDEGYSVVAAREAMSRRNKGINLIMKRSRKRDFDVLLVSQRMYMLDKDLRRLSSRVISPSLGFTNGVPSSVCLKYYHPVFESIDSAPVWKCDYSLSLAVPGVVLDSYSTYAEIYDYSHDGFEDKLRRGNKFELEVLGFLHRRGYNVTHHGHAKGDNNLADLTVSTDHSFDMVDCIGVSNMGGSSYYLNTQRKVFSSMLNVIVVYKNLNNVLRGFRVTSELLHRLPDKKFLSLSVADTLSCDLSDIYPSNRASNRME